MSKEFKRLAKQEGTTALAGRLKVPRQVVEYWLRARIPAERVRYVESVTGIPRAQLRPDLYA